MRAGDSNDPAVPLDEIAVGPLRAEQLAVVVQAIGTAGRGLVRRFRERVPATPTTKTTRADLQTVADVESERRIVVAIEDAFPGCNVHAEESGVRDRGSETTFVIDPLDGTNNFVLGIPVFTISVAAMLGDETVMGIVHQPVTGDTWCAAKGRGAFENGRRVAVGSGAQLADATLCYYCDYACPPERMIAFKTALLRLELQRVLDLWSPAFCYGALASGRIDVVVNDGIEHHDFAAGRLLAAEAGAVVTGLDGGAVGERDRRFLVSSDAAVHDQVVSRVTRGFALDDGVRP